MRPHFPDNASLAIAAVFLGFVGCASEMKRGSDKLLYTIADTLDVRREDLGKDIQLQLGQNLLFKIAADPDEPGRWELVHHDSRTLLLLSETPRVGENTWGLLLRANAIGAGAVVLRFIPNREGADVRAVKFETFVRR
ncbi:MAG: hypothetical protein HY360_25590 [Verrucomicrobia bacterium]|nr:hypothetical protein [Verrucomicrobiota bacterium]